MLRGELQNGAFTSVEEFVQSWPGISQKSIQMEIRIPVVELNVETRNQMLLRSISCIPQSHHTIHSWCMIGGWCL